VTLRQTSYDSVNESETEAGYIRPIASLRGEPASRPNLNLVGSTYPQAFEQLDVAIDDDGSIYWAFMRPHARPCFTPELLSEIRLLERGIRQEFHQRKQACEPLLKYVVFGSRVPGVYNAGGDLALFCECIRTQDRERLQRYADLCVDISYEAATSFDLPVITIALVQGDALGGGFEAALSCNLIVAEKSAKFGLPEVLFNLFPGMGAYNFLSRRLDSARAEQIILSGRVYTADEMHAMGIVNQVVEDGQGERAVQDYVQRNLRRHSAERAIYWARQLVNPVRLSDLRALAALWVDTALGLSEADLRKMTRLASAQERRRLLGQALATAAE
jgi:DSF synthase